MVKWVCLGCDIKFDSKFLNECPKCGRDSLKKDPNAEELLKEIEELFE